MFCKFTTLMKNSLIIESSAVHSPASLISCDLKRLSSFDKVTTRSPSCFQSSINEYATARTDPHRHSCFVNNNWWFPQTSDSKRGSIAFLGNMGEEHDMCQTRDSLEQFISILLKTRSPRYEIQTRFAMLLSFHPQNPVHRSSCVQVA